MRRQSHLQLAQLRQEYGDSSLNESSAFKDPFKQFSCWFNEAIGAKLYEPNAMIISTVSRTLRPSSRTVLLKSYDKNGFVFFTNYDSRKGKDISETRLVSLLFFWPELHRQIRSEGIATKTSNDVSNAYFAQRPRDAQIAAIVSKQSRVIKSRAALEKMWKKLRDKLNSQNIDRPENWGGYVVKPSRFEFWQGRRNRLHDRICYTRSRASWKINRLSP